MASFLDDICEIIELKRTFKGTHEKEILERLCDPSVSLMVWEDAALSFLNYEGIFLFDTKHLDDTADFERDLNGAFKNLVKRLSDTIKELSDLEIPALSLSPFPNGYLLLGVKELANLLHHMIKLQSWLACLAVVKVHHKARKLRNISEYVQKDTRLATAGHVSDLIRTTDEVDQSLTSFRDVRRDAEREARSGAIYDFRGSRFTGMETLLHDSIYEAAHRCAILPSRLHIYEVETMPKTHVNGGGFADIYKGTLSDGRVIALKEPRCFGKPDEIRKVHAEISKEGTVWHFSTHENVLPLLGISCIKFQSEKPDLLVLVTPWMANGTLREFLRCNPCTDRGQMISDVGSGVRYLHKLRVPPVVHGDLRCDNILVDGDGVPKIADFGLSRVKDFQASLTGTSSTGARGSLRWQAPELLSPEVFGGTGKHTFASDIYALGMTCLEIVTDEVPYFGLSEAQVITAVLHGNPPKVSRNVVYEQDYRWQWEMVQRCWSRTVEDRPSAADLC